MPDSYYMLIAITQIEDNIARWLDSMRRNRTTAVMNDMVRMKEGEIL